MSWWMLVNNSICDKKDKAKLIQHEIMNIYFCIRTLVSKQETPFIVYIKAY